MRQGITELQLLFCLFAMPLPLVHIVSIVNFFSSTQAYQSWVRDNKAEGHLPGLGLSVDQLFFLGFARVRQACCHVLQSPHCSNIFHYVLPDSDWFSWLSSFLPVIYSSLPWVINIKFPLQPHKKYYTSYNMKNLANHRLPRWKMITLPILANLLIHFSSKGWENVLFQLGSERVNCLFNFCYPTPVITALVQHLQAGSRPPAASRWLAHVQQIQVQWAVSGGSMVVRCWRVQQQQIHSLTSYGEQLLHAHTYHSRRWATTVCVSLSGRGRQGGCEYNIYWISTAYLAVCGSGLE